MWILNFEMKSIFTWWNKQTFGTLIKTIFTGKFVGRDEFGNKYYKNKGNDRWVIYSGKVEPTKITKNWFLWMHHTIDKIPDKDDFKKKYEWEKNTLKTLRTDKRHKPIKIKKNEIKKKYVSWK